MEKNLKMVGEDEDGNEISEDPRSWTYVSLQNSIWCILVTMTTIGYGDIYPVTN